MFPAVIIALSARLRMMLHFLLVDHCNKVAASVGCCDEVPCPTYPTGVAPTHPHHPPSTNLQHNLLQQGTPTLKGCIQQLTLILIF